MKYVIDSKTALRRIDWSDDPNRDNTTNIIVVEIMNDDLKIVVLGLIFLFSALVSSCELVFFSDNI
jgi:hypothetical protein